MNVQNIVKAFIGVNQIKKEGSNSPIVKDFSHPFSKPLPRIEDVIKYLNQFPTKNSTQDVEDFS